MKAIGVAVGFLKLHIVIPGSEDKPVEVGCNRVGVRQIIDALPTDDQCCIVLSGNRRWAEVLAYYLVAAGRNVRYLGRIENGSGRSSIAAALKNALGRNSFGRPFFGNGQAHKSLVLAEEETDHPWLRLARRYEQANDEIRRAKHRTMDALRLLFPELLTLEGKLWNKKGRQPLHACQWPYFRQKFQLDWQQSLGQSVPPDRRQEAERALRAALFDLKMAEDQKEELKDEIAGVVGDHPIVKAYNQSFSAMMLVLLIGWRKWGTTKRTGWFPLRSYCGLAVTRLDGKGKPRIDRRRPGIRVVLFHLLKASRGKQVITAAMIRLERNKMGRVKRIEQILRDFWRMMRGDVDEFGDLEALEARLTELFPKTAADTEAVAGASVGTEVAAETAVVE